MGEKIVNGVLKNNTKERNKALTLNKGKYKGYNQQLNVIVGENYRVYANEKNSVLKEQHEDILRYTHNGKTDFSKGLHENYSVDKETLKYYSQKTIKPSYKVNDYDGYGDYISYMWDVYGMEESYAGHLAGLMGVRELAEDLAYDIVPSFEGKNAQDVINDILRYSDTTYAMEGNRVGIVRNINVANAVNGVITTNINNYSGKESKMGLISNRLYGLSLLQGAQFNSLRGNRYITPELETLYGNNLSNVYNLSTLFSIDTENGRIVEPDSGKYLGMKMPNGNIFNYLPTVISDFKLPELEVNGEKYDWSINPNYGEDELSYNKRHIDTVTNTTIFPDNNKQILYVYSEGQEKNANLQPYEFSFSSTEMSSSISGVNPIELLTLHEESLLSKTNSFLRNRKINTILSRFHDQDNKEKTLTQTATSPFGISHGRNLLTKKAFEFPYESNGIDRINNYSNPYCRVWTAHHQYSKMKHLIRPFTEEENFKTVSELQKDWFMFRGENGGSRLSDNGVLNKNGMVNITPTSDGDVDIKKCMFSIENLAWKDILVSEKGCYRLENGDFVEDNEAILSKEQRGPNGGRIMWFPPYDLNFQETAQASWSSNDFIGRGEPVYTYTNSKRSGTLDFTILVDHPSVVNYWMLDKKNNATESDEQTLLRYFAGCETIEPNPNTLYYLNNGLDPHGNYKDPSLDDKQDAKDIVFYTFFPNYYSACDDNGNFIENGLDIIFGGRCKDNDVRLSDEEIESLQPKIVILYEGGRHRSLNIGRNKLESIVVFTYETTNIDNSKINEIEFTKIGGSADFEVEHKKENKEVKITIKENDTNHYRYDKYCLKYKETIELEVLIYQDSTDSDNFTIPDDIKAIEILDGGVVSETKSLFLGYEMGVNPMSINKILFKEVESSSALYIDKIYDYAEAEKIYAEDLSGFTETIELSKGDLLEQEIVINDKSIKYYYEDFNRLIDKNDKSQDKKIENVETIRTLEKEKEKLEKEKEKLEEEKEKLEKELTNYTTGTTAYNQVSNLITLKTNEITANSNEIENRVKQKEKLQQENQNTDTELNNLNEIETKIVNKFEIDTELCCTKPLYIYYNYTDDEGVKNDANFNLDLSAAAAYTKWKIRHLDKIKVNDIDAEPYQLLTSKEFVCETIRYYINNDKPEEKSKFWIKELVKDAIDIPYKEVKNKNDLNKKGLKFGKKKNSSKFYVSIKGSIIEYNSKKEADESILSTNIIPIMTEEEFKESNEIVAIIKDDVGENKAYRYMYYNLVEKTQAQLENAMVNFLNVESNNSNAYIVKKYYENHKFGSFKNFGVGENYGVFQLFYTGKLQENGESYETIQDIIARHNFITNPTEVISNDKVLKYKTFAFSKHSYTENSIGYGKVDAEIEWNLESPVFSYPVDNLYKNKKLTKNGNKNYYDMQSLGLNSTLEAVKHFTNNPDATYSFGEVYAALKGDVEKEFVLYCERGILHQVLGKNGEELENLVKEADNRIEYLKGVFNQAEEQTDLQITEILTKGTASSHGSNSENQILSENRRKSLEGFLKSFTSMSKIKTGKETSSIIPEEENNIVPVGENNDDISSEQAKIGRCARAIIVIGKKDVLESEKKYFQEINKEKADAEAKQRKAMRYDNERLFFEMLRENDNIAYNRLVDKVKYFSPAFHSITPEGFNARLTFLHQCTRQGPTATTSDVSTGTTAANLAFGRAPFCVLRLGDFLNTKIVIESVNITYPDAQWDLNPEGIGVQFMMAKVSMQIHILGGSDISAPIKRLQNAVSFNYYANTSIYDNRSDTAVYDNGEILDTKQWFSSPKPIEGDI